MSIEYGQLTPRSLLNTRSSLLRTTNVASDFDVRPTEKSSSKKALLFVIATLTVLFLLLMIAFAWSIRTDDTNLQPVTPSVATPTLTQVSISDAILGGLYEGNVTIGEIRGYGTFGLGIFNQLDGELVVLDGVFYRYNVDGTDPTIISDNQKVPFALISNAPTLSWQNIPQKLSYILNASTNLTDYLDSLVHINHMYAVRIEGTFVSVEIAVASQQSRPYKPFWECVFPKQQRLYFQNTSGTAICFRSPTFTNGLISVGYHCYFATADRTQGGRVVSLFTGSGSKVSLTQLDSYRLLVPNYSTVFDQMLFPYKLQDPTKVC